MSNKKNDPRDLQTNSASASLSFHIKTQLSLHTGFLPVWQSRNVSVDATSKSVARASAGQQMAEKKMNTQQEEHSAAVISQTFLRLWRLSMHIWCNWHSSKAHFSYFKLERHHFWMRWSFSGNVLNNLVCTLKQKNPTSETHKDSFLCRNILYALVFLLVKSGMSNCSKTHVILLRPWYIIFHRIWLLVRI